MELYFIFYSHFRFGFYRYKKFLLKAVRTVKYKAFVQDNLSDMIDKRKCLGFISFVYLFLYLAVYCCKIQNKPNRRCRRFY